MGKLNEYVVTSLHIVLGILPQFVVAAAGVTSALGVVDAGPPVGEEVTEVHAPTTRLSGAFVVRCHRGVAQRVHLLGADTQRTEQQHQGH